MNSSLSSQSKVNLLIVISVVFLSNIAAVLFVVLHDHPDRALGEWFTFTYLVIFNVNFLFYIIKRDFSRWSTISLCLFIVVLWFLFYEGGIEESGFIWSFLFPSAAYLFKGYKTGTYFTALLFIGILAIYLLSLAGLFTVPHHLQMLFVFLSVFIAAAAILFIYSRQIMWNEKTIISSKEKFETLFNNLSSGVILVSPEMKILEANDTIKNWFPLEELVQNKCCYEILDRSINSPCQDCPVKKSFQDGKIHSIVQDKMTKNGLRSFRVTANPIVDSSGKVTAVMDTLDDVTERRKVNQALRESEQKFRLVAENATDVIWILDYTSQSFIYVSPSVEKLLHYTPEEMLSVRFPEVFTTESFQLLVKSIPQHIAEFKQGITRTYFNELEQVRKDGSVLWTETTNCYAYDQNNGSLIVFGTTRNISERKETEATVLRYTEELESVNQELGLAQALIENALMEKSQLNELLIHAKEELEKLNAQKDKFLALIAHDLRSPFNGFIGLTQIMVEEINELSKEELLKFVTDLNNKANALFNLLTNLLEWARVQQGHLDFEPTQLDLFEITAKVVSSLEQNFAKKMIDIQTDIPLGTSVFADKNMLNSIVLNLVTNAIKFTPPNGSIHITAEKTDDRMVRFSVKDTGIGMSAELLQKLFRIDQKVNRKGTQGEESTGLGLLLCKEFAEKNGGTIRAESTIGKGSTFIITLPSGLQ